jgi:hypothetical protein
VPTGATTYTYSSGSDVVSPLTTTSYTVTGANTFGCTSDAVNTITVSTTPTVGVTSGGVCTGGSYTIVPTGATSYTYSSGSDVVTPLATTDYTVTGANVDGCTSYAVVTVSVNPTLAFNPNSGSTCEGTSFTMTPTGAVSYTFSSGSAVVTPSATTSYTINGVNSVGCYGTEVCIVTVNTLPTVTANSATICVGESFTITPSGALTYTFSSGSDVVSPTVTTTYSVTGTDANGCNSATDALSNVTVDLCVGLQNLTAQGLSIQLYPNPTTGLVQVELNTHTQVTISNALGQVIMHTELNAGKQIIDLRNEEMGIYFVQFNQNGKQQTVKVVKQ